MQLLVRQGECVHADIEEVTADAVCMSPTVLAACRTPHVPARPPRGLRPAAAGGRRVCRLLRRLPAACCALSNLKPTP